MDLLDRSIHSFTEQLASPAPVPGGGGASALVGAIGIALVFKLTDEQAAM